MSFKSYLNDLVCEMFPDNGFAQDAIEFAILHGHVRVVMDREKDQRAIMDDYDRICELFHVEVQANRALLWESYLPMLEAIKEAGRIQPKGTE